MDNNRPAASRQHQPDTPGDGSQSNRHQSSPAEVRAKESLQPGGLGGLLTNGLNELLQSGIDQGIQRCALTTV